MIGLYPRLRYSTGDGFLDMLACSYADAFSDAETDVSARMDIVEIFDPDILRALHTKRCITWDPDAVPVQATLGVVP